MEYKMLRLRKDLREANQRVDYLINDLNKLKNSSEEENSEELKGGK